MAEWPEFDWAHNPDYDPSDTFGEAIHKELGGIAHRLLDSLSHDVTTLEADVYGWTKADGEAIADTQQADSLARLVVPPKTVPDMVRVDFMELMVEFRTALPFTEAERAWLLDGNGFPTTRFTVWDGPWQEIARQSEAEVMSAGIRRVIHGRDLLQRWWSWRRETGEYEEQGSLEQAREALGGLIALVSPELGLPESYVALRAARGDEPFTP